MCGIVGIVRNDGNPVDEQLLSRMNDAIRHRGPDEDGFYVNGSVGMAMRRLTIIDLKSGQQPIHNHDRSSWIVFNGEIYNYLELREKLEKLGHTFYTNSDTEAIVHAYDQFGADCPKHLRGMFAFAIWNERTQERVLARDRVGKKPLLYAHVNGHLDLRSEFSALLLHPDVSRDIQTRSARLLPLVHVHPRAADRLPRDSKAGAGTLAALAQRRDRDTALLATGLHEEARRSARKKPASARSRFCAKRCACD